MARDRLLGGFEHLLLLAILRLEDDAYVDEGQAAVLVFLGDGDDEAQVALDELLEGVLIAGANFLREVDLFRPLEERIGADLIEVLVEDIALGSFGAIPAGAARRRRRLSSVMLLLPRAEGALKFGIYRAAARCSRIASV